MMPAPRDDKHRKNILKQPGLWALLELFDALMTTDLEQADSGKREREERA